MDESELPLLCHETSSSSSTRSESDREISVPFESKRNDEDSYNSRTAFFSPLWTSDKCCINKDNLKSVLLVLLVIQGSSAILLGRYTRSAVAEEELYEISHLILVIECVKFLISLLAEHISTKGNLRESVDEHILKRPMDSCKVLVPAVLYVIQNSLVYIALSNLSAPVFISLQQGKLIATAIVSVGMLQRTYSLKQWICLFVLAVGVAIVALDEKNEDRRPIESNNSGINELEDMDTEPEQFFFVGVLAVTGACFSSAFAGVYFEKVLAPEKAARSLPNTTDLVKPQETTTIGPSLWMRNMQLAFFSIIFCFVQTMLDSNMANQISSMTFDDDEVVADSSDDETDDPKPCLHGFTVWVWVLVFLQACGGLLVAAVMKWADNVLKGLAMGIGVVVSSALSTLLFNVHLSQQFAFGAFIICASVYSFSNDFPTSQCLRNQAKG